jgi:hypothetical protein
MFCAMQLPERLFFLCCCFLLTTFVNAQQYSTTPIMSDLKIDTPSFPRYRILQAGISLQTLRDPLLTLLRYQGSGYSLQLSTLKFKPRLVGISQFRFQLNTLGNKVNGALILQTGTAYSYGLYKRIPLGSGHRFYAGGYAEGLFNLRIALNNVNNILSYETGVLLGASGLWQKPFRLFKRAFMLSDQLNVPLFALFSRPPYAWSYPTFLEETGKFSDALQASSFNKWLQLRNALNLDFYQNIRHKKKLIQKKAWRISYYWEYLRIADVNKVQSGFQQLTIGRIYTF